MNHNHDYENPLKPDPADAVLMNWNAQDLTTALLSAELKEITAALNRLEAHFSELAKAAQRILNHHDSQWPTTG